MIDDLTPPHWDAEPITTAPERIWADFNILHDQIATTYCQDGPYQGGTEYIRADLAAVQSAQEVHEEQNTEQRKRFWNWLPLAYHNGHIGEQARFTKYNMEVAHYAGWCHALEPQPDPRDEVIKGLVEALEWQRDQPEAHPFMKLQADAALAAAKAVQRG